MSELKCNPMAIADTVHSIKAHATAIDRYRSFTVDVGGNDGRPKEALLDASQGIQELATAELTLINKLIDNVLADVAVLTESDADLALMMSLVGQERLIT